jgi:hypothetical protein
MTPLALACAALLLLAIVARVLLRAGLIGAGAPPRGVEP